MIYKVSYLSRSCYAGIFQLTSILGANGPASGSGALLLEARSLKDARSACEAVGEQLWPAELGTKSIQTSLDYLKYTGSDLGTPQFWVASGSQGVKAVNINGSVFKPQSSAQLPVLCTHSAPFSNETSQDTSEKWQITVKSNNESLTGYIQITNTISEILGGADISI